MKTIGLLGGMSWESTAHYYRLLNQDHTPLVFFDTTVTHVDQAIRLAFAED